MTTSTAYNTHEIRVRSLKNGRLNLRLEGRVLEAHPRWKLGGIEPFVPAESIAVSVGGAIYGKPIVLSMCGALIALLSMGWLVFVEDLIGEVGFAIIGWVHLIVMFALLVRAGRLAFKRWELIRLTRDDKTWLAFWSHDCESARLEAFFDQLRTVKEKTGIPIEGNPSPPIL